MDDLTYDLKQLCHRNRDGGRKTQVQRMQSLKLIAKQLKDAGFDKMHATSLKGKHVDALVDRWKAENLSAGTIKNRMMAITFEGPAPERGVEVLKGELRAGEVMTGAEGRAIALMRLDRMDGDLTVEGRPVRVEKPDWIPNL